MMNGRNRPYRTDLFVLFGTIAVLALVFTIGDIAGDEPDWWLRATGQKQGPTPPPHAPGGDGDETYELRMEEVLDIADTTAEGQTTSIRMTFIAANATYLHIVLSWTDDIGSNDEFELSVDRNGEVLQTISSTSGQIEMRINEPGPGNYSVWVTALDCPGQLELSPVDRDGGNAWNLYAELERRVVVE